MVSKKRSSVSVVEEGPKKRRKDNKGEESTESRKKLKKNKEYVVKVKDDRLSDDEDVEEEEEEEIPHDDIEPKGETNDTLKCPPTDMVELFSRIEAQIPANDNLSYATRAERLDWDEIAFKNYSPAECKNLWTHVQKKLRRFRILKEVIADARQWIHKPWTSFYNGAKQNQHPDMPRRPLTQYMVYYMEKKDKVAAQNPHLDMTNLSKVVSRMYRALPDHKKEKYLQKAAELREEYQAKLRQFYEKHPECKEVKSRSKDSRSQSLIPGGLKKPRTPQQIFLEERISKLKDDPKFDKAEVLENARQQWKNLSDKKRLVWINWALEEENKYQDAVKLYIAEHPDYQAPAFKSVLKKEEMTLRDRAAGKPAKPPNSAYSMYSRIMLGKCPSLRELVPKARMKEISIRWHEMSEAEKAEYAQKVKYEQDQYKLEYATYLESLPEDERQEELMKTQSKKKKIEHPEVEKEVNNGKKANKSRSRKGSKKSPEAIKKLERLYFPGEPHQPPVNAYELFVDSFVNDTKLSATEAPRFWEMLPSSDKAKFQRKLKELKDKYIKDYKKFLKSLDEEQLAKYNDLQKQNKELEAASEAQKSHNSDNEADDNDSDGNEDSSSEDETQSAPNNVAAENADSDSDEDEEKKAVSSSDSSSSSSSGSSSSSSSSDDSDSSSDDSDDEDKKTNVNNIKKEISDSDSSDDD